MVIMASSFARGRVRATTTESRIMAAKLQITGWQRDMQPWFTVYFFGIGHPCYDQLTPVKTRYPLTSITWPYRGLKLTAHRGQVFFEVDRWPGAGFSIRSRAHVSSTCLNRAGLFGRRLMLTQDYNFFFYANVFAAFFVHMVIIETQNSRPKQYTENLSAKLQNSNQNSTFSWVSLIGLWTTRSRSYAFRLA